MQYKDQNPMKERIMREITNYFIMHGYAPSLREIGDAAGLKSTSTVARYVDTLINEGKLESEAKNGASRAYRVKGMRVVFVDNKKGN